jgi:glycine/D-amino acid oxidase-like deaminating enzyme
MDLKSGAPFWPLTNGLIASYPALQGDLDCEVAVIGGGITGALVAYHLVEAGIATVLLDKRDFGWGSTSATTALLQYELDTPLHELVAFVGEGHAVRSYKACLEAINKLERLVAHLNASCGFERKKSVYLASRRRDVAALKREYELRSRYGFRVDWLDRQHIEADFSFSRPAALRSHDAAQVDAYRLLHALLQQATQKGLRAYDRTAVTQHAPTPGTGGVTLTTDRTCRVTARKVVYATGYESVEVLKQPVVRLKSTYALASEPLQAFPGWHEQCLIWEAARPYFYLRTTSDGRAMMGGEDEDFVSAIKRDRLLEKKTAKLQKQFQALFPEIEMEVAFSWAGTFGETKDGLAYIGEHTAFSDTYFALGYGGNGITFSLLAAEIVRDAYLKRRNDDASLFRFDR